MSYGYMGFWSLFALSLNDIIIYKLLKLRVASTSEEMDLQTSIKLINSKVL